MRRLWESWKRVLAAGRDRWRQGWTNGGRQPLHTWYIVGMAIKVKSSALRVNVTPEVSAELERLAEEEDVSVAHVVRKALRLYLDEIDKTKSG